MALIEWPKWLPTCETSTKRITTKQGFRTNEVLAGTPYVELVTTDTPTTFQVTFKFTRDQARAFDAWDSLNGLSKESGWVNFPIQIAEGLTNQEVLVLERFAFSGQENNVFNYTGALMARSIKSDDREYPEAILAMFECNQPCYSICEAGKLLDTAINVSWPEA